MLFWFLLGILQAAVAIGNAAESSTAMRRWSPVPPAPGGRMTNPTATVTKNAVVLTALESRRPRFR